jgi:hypothetical protein
VLLKPTYIYQLDVAHFLQIHALLIAWAGTLERVSALKTNEAHQHSSKGLPVILAISIAHWLGSPQTGQMLGSI